MAIWARGAAKSTSAEMLVADVGATGRRKYCLYVCGRQEQADDHVANVAGLLGSDPVERYYPAISRRAVGKYGSSKGWRRNRLWTEAGFVVDAIGLDVAARGVKLDEQRPDLIIFDDIDDTEDSTETTAKKLRAINKKLIPAGSSDVAILCIQNLVIPDGVFAQWAAGTAESLASRIVSGPIPALIDMTYEKRPEPARGYVITGGTPTWAGQDIDVCQAQMDDEGLTSFLEERQHEVNEPDGGMFSHIDFRHITWDELSKIPMVRVVVAVDPAVTDTDDSDSHAIQAASIDTNETIYMLRSFERRTTPLDSLRAAILMAVELQADTVLVETDQGGDTWQTVFSVAVEQLIEEKEILRQDAPRFASDKAGAGHGPKVARASQMLTDYERGEIVHVQGTHTTLEKALRRFPKKKPFDLVDATYWAWGMLRHGYGSSEDYGNVVPSLGPRETRRKSAWQKSKEAKQRALWKERTGG